MKHTSEVNEQDREGKGQYWFLSREASMCQGWKSRGKYRKHGRISWKRDLFEPYLIFTRSVKQE